MHLRGRILLTFLLFGAALCSIRLDRMFDDAQRQNNVIIRALGASADARETLLPGVFRTALRGRGSQARTSQRRDKHLEPRLAATSLHVGPRDASGVPKLNRKRVCDCRLSVNCSKGERAREARMDINHSHATRAREGPSLWAALFGIAYDQSPWQYMLSLRKQGYGGVTKVPLGPFGGDFFFLLEPDALKQVLLEQAEEYFPSRYSVPLFDVLQLNRGIVYEQGARHRRQKRLCIPSFEQSRSMNTFLAAIKEETSALSEKWCAQSTAAENGVRRLRPQFDLYREMRQLTLSVILRVTFGLGTAGREYKDAEALSRTIGSYLEAIVATANEIPPLWQINPALSPNYRSVVDELLPRLRKLVAGVIAERRGRDDSEITESVDRADLLSLLLNEGSLSDEDILFVLFDLVIAGSDTTASTITAALFILHEPRHAMSLLRVRAELVDRDVAGLALEEIKDALPFLSAVAREVLRLYPPVPFVGRTSSAASTVCGVEVPAGSTMCFSPYALGRDPASWGETADDFRPERWLDSPSTGGAPSSFCWLPFGAGPRGCLGTRLGLTEVVIAVAVLLQRFDFSFDQADKGLRYKYDLTLNLDGTALCETSVRSEH